MITCFNSCESSGDSTSAGALVEEEEEDEGISERELLLDSTRSG